MGLFRKKHDHDEVFKAEMGPITYQQASAPIDYRFQALNMAVASFQPAGEVANALITERAEAFYAYLQGFEPSPLEGV